MRLIDLHPKYGATNGVRTHLIFDCPNCTHAEDEKCRIAIPFAGESTAKWTLSAVQSASEMFQEPTFDQISLSPSVWFNKGKSNPASCESHFFVENGEIRIV